MYKIPLSRPSYLSFTDEVCAAVEKVIRSRMIAQGERVAEFESMITAYVGTKYAIAVSSGTAGLYLCLKALGIGQGDEVITTPFSFIASSNVILWAGAKPIFCDIERDTYNIDLLTLRKRTLHPTVKALLPVDVFGNPCKTELMGLQGIPIILDSCESFGTKMQRPFDACVYAFYPNKQLTTGEGGCICTDNHYIADYCRAARNQGRSTTDTWLESSMIGWNFRMSDIHATIGIEQLKRWDEIVQKRVHIWNEYSLRLKGLVKMQKLTSGIEFICPFVFTVEVPNRDKVMTYLLDHGIECKPYFPCIHLQKPYREMGYHEGMFPVAEEVSRRTLAIPFFTDMQESEVDGVCGVLKEALDE